MIKNSIIAEDISHIIERFNGFSEFNNKTILISGAAGVLPSYLVDTLMSLDAKFKIKIIALVRSKKKAEKRFIHWKEDHRLILVEHDICNPFIPKINIDFIIHAASQASPKYYGIDPVGTLNANILGTLNLLNLARDQNVESFLFFSSGEVYGEVSDENCPIKENYFGFLDPTNVRSCYGESKRMAENMCVSYHSQFGVKAKIVRPFHTYGPGLQLDDGRVFADFISNVLEKKDIELKSDGTAIRAFCYISDATIGFLTILLFGMDGQAYNMGNPNEEKSILELAKIVANLYPELKLSVIENSKPINNSNYIKSPIHRNSPDIEKLMKLGWYPEVTVQEGFKRTIQSY
jgi:UDP-glucuronate decarboxylase